MLHALGIALLAARLLHGYALSFTEKFPFGRIWGATLTFVVLGNRGGAVRLSRHLGPVDLVLRALTECAIARSLVEPYLFTETIRWPTPMTK